MAKIKISQIEPISTGDITDFGDFIDQALRTTDAPTFDDLTLTNPVNIYALSHDSFADYVGSEHIDHDNVDFSAGAGLTGGGKITANRNFAVGEGTGITVNADSIEADFGAIDHDQLLNYILDEHIDWTNAIQDFKTAGRVEVANEFRYSSTDGGFFVGSAGQALLGFSYDSATPEVNFLVITPSNTGNAVQIETFGDDTDIDFNIVAKNDGIINLDSDTLVQGKLGINRIPTNGQVEVGIDESSAMRIVLNSAPTFFTDHATNGIYINPLTQSYGLYKGAYGGSAIACLYISPVNKVGILTNNPGYDFDVNGSVRAVGKVHVDTMKSAQTHPTNFKPVYVDTDTGELYRIA